MAWFSSIGTTEIIFTIGFVVLYLAYITRVIRLSRKLGTSFGKLFYKVFIRTTYFALFIIALLGPSFGQSSKEIQSVGKDIMIAVDLSQSMNANDVPPSRLEKVKYELKNLVDAFSADRIGLVIFSSEAFIQCPLTYDQNALHLFIETLNTGLVPNTGTDFGPAIGLALNKLENNEGSSLDQKSKVLILVSDGEDFGEETSEVLEQVRNRDIRLFALGVGTIRGSKIPTRNGFKKDQSGADVVSQLNAPSLKNLASKTGGKYFEINATSNDINRLVNTITNIEGELRDTRKIDVSANKYYYFLAVALFLLLFDGFTSLKTIRI